LVEKQGEKKKWMKKRNKGEKRNVTGFTSKQGDTI